MLEHEGKQFTVDPKTAGLTFDLDRSIDDAGGNHSFDPRKMVGLVFGTHEFDPAVDADEDSLGGIVSAIATTVDVEVVEAQITFPKSKPTPREPKAGLVVRKADTVRAVIDGYLVARGPIDVPTAVVEPAVDADGLDEAMTEIAEPAVSGPVVIRVGEKKVNLPVSAYAPALVVRVKDDKLQPDIDPEKLAKPLTDSTTGIGKKAVDATVKVENGKAVVVPGKEGVGLQPKEMAVKLVPAITETGDARSVEIEAKVVDPEFTTEDAKKLKIKEKISSFSTFFPYAEYRNVNQGRAAELIDGTILEPGETFSLNDTVGERTVANGFTKGTVINGGVFREELGGGVSQVATTTYNAGFFGGMDDVEHHPHAFYIDRYPMGREATVYYGNLDMRFRNPTDYGVLIRANVRREHARPPGRDARGAVEHEGGRHQGGPVEEEQLPQAGQAVRRLRPLRAARPDPGLQRRRHPHVPARRQGREARDRHGRLPGRRPRHLRQEAVGIAGNLLQLGRGSRYRYSWWSTNPYGSYSASAAVLSRIVCR